MKEGQIKIGDRVKFLVDYDKLKKNEEATVIDIMVGDCIYCETDDKKRDFMHSNELKLINNAKS
jgi:hypothetical protein